jgi:hypothetical protein
MPHRISVANFKTHIFLQAVFISFVILHCANIFVASLLQQPTFVLFSIGAFISLMTIIARVMYIRKYAWQTVFLSMIGLSIIIFTQLISGRDFKSSVGYLFLASISVFIVSLWKKREEIFAIKVFIILCSIISLLGIIAWINVNYTFIVHNYIDPAHLIDIEVYTNGGALRGYGDAKNFFGISQNAYSFPYSLGLVLTGSYAYDFFGLPLFRASGIFHEPLFNSIMIIPPIIFTLNSIYFKKWSKRIILGILFCYLIATFSLSIIFSLILTYILYNIFVLLNSSRSLISIRLFKFIIIFSLIGCFGYYTFNIIPSSGIGRNILNSKLTSTNYIARVFNNIFSLNTFTTYCFFVSVSFACLWRAVKTNNKDLRLYSLILVSLLIVTTKGILYQFLVNPAFLIFYFLMLKNFGRSAKMKMQTLRGAGG